jgi:hypothetical protein
LEGVGLSPPKAHAQRFAYGCLDWSERRDHLAGALGKALLDHFVQQGWLRKPASPASRGGRRALMLTPLGRRRLLPMLALG